ncbi:MAG TPA: aconitase family protein, partial [Polyangiaceae bacterium]|nr:aconitase family protein [Polyangiaceae bacterium]
MCEKLLASHGEEGRAVHGLVRIKVDQVVLARAPNRVLATALSEGLQRSQVEVSVAYPPRCILGPADAEPGIPEAVAPEALDLGFLVAQPGAGFAAPMHLERFGSPGRVLLTDEPRLAGSGAAAMLCLPASQGQLSEALRTGQALIRPPRSVQIQLTGRLRPFVCVRDVALDLMRRGLREVVQMVDAEHGAPVVLEFTGPSARYLSVADRAVLCAVAPRLGAAAALFASDEKTESFLRDQRRSKAQRALAPDPGACWDEMLSLDLAAVDPLLLDEEGRIRPVRDLDGRPVAQVLLGGDTGVTLRDLLAAATLLKSKRVPPGVHFLLAPPSRQMLEVLARDGALLDLISTGARLVEPDRRVLSGDLYPVRSTDGCALYSADPEFSAPAARGLVASAETLAYAVAHGVVGDPRLFKRPVRVTLPRDLPTDDVLLSRGAEQRGGAKGKGRVDKKAGREGGPPNGEQFGARMAPASWNGDARLALLRSRARPSQPSALLTERSEDVQWLAEHAADTP